MPRKFRVALRNRQSFGPSGSTGTAYLTTLGLLEFFGSIPGYTDRLYDLYKWCKVLSVEVKFAIINTTSSNPVQFVVGVMPFSSTGSMTIDRAAEISGSTVRLVSSQGGIDKTEIIKTYNTQTVVGSLVAEKYWVNKAQASSTSPIEPDEPIIFLMAQPLISVNWSSQVVVDMTYHVEFFDLNAPL